MYVCLKRKLSTHYTVSPGKVISVFIYCCYFFVIKRTNTTKLGLRIGEKEKLIVVPFKLKFIETSPLLCFAHLTFEHTSECVRVLDVAHLSLDDK